MRRWILPCLAVLMTVTWLPLRAEANNPTLTSYADLVERLSPAVVNIATKTEAKRLRRTIQNPFGEINPFAGTPFEQFFWPFAEEFGQGFGDFQTLPTQSLGTGVLISTDGFIVTNNHVIAPNGEPADEIVVKLSNSKHDFPARLVGRDEKTDVALLKINATTALPAAKLGSSAPVRVGEAVLAIGNPFGLGGTVTTGIVSALARNIGQGPYDDFIQTDAAINPGNSGGPLFNVQGEVIGINTAIFSRSGGSNGIGFAIPAETVRQVVAQLKQNGRVERSYLGVKVQTLTPDLAKGLGLKETAGALVAEVTAGSPAAQAGLREGDVIVRFDGRAIDEVNDLPKLVASTPVGKRVNVQLLRNGKPLQMSATLRRMPGEEAQNGQPTFPKETESDTALSQSLGLVVAALTPAVRQYHGIPESVEGLMLVRARGVAAEAGLRPGDVLLAADLRPISDLASLRRALARKAGQTVVLRIWRADGAIFVPLPVPAADE